MNGRPTTTPRRAVLDGNVLAGVLSDLFAGDPTLVVIACGHCGATGALGGTVVEADDVAYIVRCRACTRTLLTVLRRGADVELRLAGAAWLRHPTSPEA